MRKSTWNKSAVALSVVGVVTIALATPSWAGASASAVKKKSIYDVQAAPTRQNTQAAGTASSVEFSSITRTPPRSTNWK